jgi:hypothetical protein
MSRILIKFPTRSRHIKAYNTLKQYINMASSTDNLEVIVSVDRDDDLHIYDIFKFHPCIKVVVGNSEGKIAAINRDIPDLSTFDILLLASDDMIPVVKGYDNIIRSKMSQNFPDGDGVLFFNDGYTGYMLNTLVICGSKYYERFGYIYYPEYKSLWCDNEFTDNANRLGRQIYFNDIIIRHEHPSNTGDHADELYLKNESLFSIDEKTYFSRKNNEFDLSVLICTIPSRNNMFVDLLNNITRLKQKTRLTIEVLFNKNENITIGEKRNKLLASCNGTYCCFIDDDDKITDDYFTVIEESELMYDCISLNGMMYTNGVKNRPFYHSLKYNHWYEDSNGYYRNPNHLNPIKTSIAKKIGFTNKNYGEDHDFSKKLQESRLLKSEYLHDKLQYIYLYVDKPVPPPMPPQPPKLPLPLPKLPLPLPTLLAQQATSKNKLFKLLGLR